MPDESDNSFAARWESLHLDSLAAAVMDPGQTLTPHSLHYGERADPDADTLLRTPDPRAVQAGTDLGRLPRLPLDGHEADLVLESVLGTGGMGVVHLARQWSLQREVAVKRLAKPAPERVEALLREARVTGSLEHPNIVPVHALGCDEAGQPVLVMKRVEGLKWSALARERPATDPEGLDHHLRILGDVCNALHYAHSRGVVHRDVKLANVMVGSFGEVYLLDWGIATLVGGETPDSILGTPAYMAPEMVTGGPATPRTDVYLLGATLHHLLMGKGRHSAASFEDTLRSAFASVPFAYPQQIPEELAAICHKAMARAPDDRYPTALAVQDAVREFVKHRGSMQIAKAAAGRLDELFATLADPKADPRRCAEGLAACRMALKEALGTWPENAAAKRDLVRLLERAVPWLVEQGDAEAAEAQLAELIALDDPTRHTALAERVAHAARKHEALSKLGQGLDMSASAGPRLAFLLAGWLVTTAFGATMLVAVHTGVVKPTHGDGIAVAVAMVGAILAGVLIARRHLLTNLADKRVMWSIFAIAMAVLVHRIVGAGIAMDPLDVYVQDLTVLATGTVVFGITIARRVMVLATMLVAATLIAMMLPNHVLDVLAVSVSAGWLLLALLFSPWARP